MLRIIDHRSCQYVIKRGFYLKNQDTKKIQRYFCISCKQGFSKQTYRADYNEHKPWVNKKLMQILCSEVSQKRSAEILGINHKTVALKIPKIAQFAKNKQEMMDQKSKSIKKWLFDEMETFEHSKCKPISIALAVEEKSRKILGIYAAQMPAKGHLVERAKKKYGFRKDLRAKSLSDLMTSIKQQSIKRCEIKSDENPRYPKWVKRFFPNASYLRSKGRRGCVVGQGELKRGGFDPLFSLNHSCAMIRDNLKRLSRRTWCTTKKICVLQDFLDMYRYFHNKFRLRQNTLSTNNGGS